MRKWLVRRLFRLCFAIDFREAIAQAQISALSWIMTQEMFDDNEPEPAPKKRGRPLGSKNKPKETLQ